MVNNSHSQTGFALLMSLIVVGVVLSVGLAILDVSIKQISLSNNAKESEKAFHAANAGMECAHYWRREVSDQMESGSVINFECFAETQNNVSPTDVTAGVTGDGVMRRYDYEFTWGEDPRCTKVATLVTYADIFPGVGVTITNNALRTELPGYPIGPSKVCNPGEQCTLITTRGYNSACADVAGYGVTEREVLLEF